MSTGRVVPQALFDLAAYELEHKPSVERQKKMQEAALEERNDTNIPVDTRIMHLRRMARWLAVLIEQLEEECTT